nr:hypothetical protein Iba_chr06eCG6230 [Ipomoea batatas]
MAMGNLGKRTKTLTKKETRITTIMETKMQWIRGSKLFHPPKPCPETRPSEAISLSATMILCKKISKESSLACQLVIVTQSGKSHRDCLFSSITTRPTSFTEFLRLQALVAQTLIPQLGRTRRTKANRAFLLRCVLSRGKSVNLSRRILSGRSFTTTMALNSASS